MNVATITHFFSKCIGIMEVQISLFLCTFLWIVVEAIPTETNIDAQKPRVIVSPARVVDPEDGFGWAAIFHQLELLQADDTMDEALRKTRVLIGAPRGTYPGGLNLTDPGEQASPKTGLVYSCPVGPGECEGVRGDTARYIGAGLEDITNGFQNSVSETEDLFVQPIAEGRLFDQAPDSDALGGVLQTRQTVERKQNQLMGSVLYSNGDTIVACAPRWVFGAFFIGASEPRGICFSGSRTLDNFKTQLPCTEDGSSASTIAGGFCSGGFSVAVTDNLIHLGAPGFEESSGAVYSRPLSAAIDSPFTETINHLNVGAMRGTYQASYHGFQMTNGYVTTNDRSQPPELLVVSPRDNETMYIGRVYMYSTTSVGTIQPTAVAEGTQMGEFFGYSIALSDLTGDGYDELLVGAPMYTSLDPLTAERGRLYVFFNNQGEIDPDPVIINGLSAYDRLGFSVTNLGDINADGHEDIAVSAPYEQGGSTRNTGAVYVYYGRDTRTDFQRQTPQKIHANDIVNSVDEISIFRTFGFSLSGNIDVDNNKYKDLVVGGYVDQTVVVLRSLPLVNVTVNFDAVEDIGVALPEPSAQINISARYEGVEVPGPITIPFVLFELQDGAESRLFFTRGDTEHTQLEDSFTFPGPNMAVNKVFTVYAQSDFTETRPYRLQIDLRDIERVVDAQLVPDLSAFPRIRQRGVNMATVNLINPCGDNGCESDVALTIDTENVDLSLVQGEDRRITLPMMYSNIGMEEARGVNLSISNFPPGIFRRVFLTSNAQTSGCQDNETTILCPIQDRFRENMNQSAVLTLVINSASFDGSVAGFNATVNLEVDTSDSNTDVDSTNNAVTLPFTLTSVSDINVDLSFETEKQEYEGIVPTSPDSPSDLGEPISLFVRVGNTGPSTVLRSRVEVMFPAGVPGSDSLFYLYPSRVIAQHLSSAGTDVGIRVECSTPDIDPQDLDSGDAFTFEENVRRKRSIPKMLMSKQGRRLYGRRASHVKRQVSSSQGVIVDCPNEGCATTVCDIERLGTDFVSINFELNIDERFFGSRVNRDNYTIVAMASATIVNEFQRANDDSVDNSDSASITLFPMAVTADNNLQLIHIIIWPIVGGILLLVLFVIFLYCVGFFKRSKGEEEAEDMISADKYSPNSDNLDAGGGEVAEL